MLVPRSIKRIILYLGAGPRTDAEIREHLGVDETLLMSALTQKPYRDYFHAEHKANASRLTLSELGWDLLEELREDSREREQRKHAELRYWVTTAIAVLALLLALIK